MCSVKIKDKATNPSEKDVIWLYRTLRLLGGLLLWRSFYAGIVPMDLIVDEACFWN